MFDSFADLLQPLPLYLLVGPVLGGTRAQPLATARAGLGREHVRVEDLGDAGPVLPEPVLAGRGVEGPRADDFP